MLKNFIHKPRIGDIIKVSGIFEDAEFDGDIGEIVKLIDKTDVDDDCGDDDIYEYNYDFGVNFNKFIYYYFKSNPPTKDDIASHDLNGVLNNDHGYFFKIDDINIDDGFQNNIIIEYLYNDNDNVITF